MSYEPSARRAAGTIRSAFTPSRFRDGACCPGRFTLQARMAADTIRWALPLIRFPGEAGAPVRFTIRACEESRRLERHGLTRAVVSSDAQHPDWFTLLGAPGGDRTLTPCGTGSWDRCVYRNSTTSACERLTRFERATLTLAR